MTQTIVTFHVPTDRELLALVGEIAIRHEHLNYILKMTIRSLTNIEVDKVLNDMKFKGSGILRNAIIQNAKNRLNGESLTQLISLIDECQTLTKKRNNLIHGIWAKELDGDTQLRDTNEAISAVPSITELQTLINELESLTVYLNNERLDGFLSCALQE